MRLPSHHGETILRYLLKHGPSYQYEIAQALEISKHSIHRAWGTLKELEYIETREGRETLGPKPSIGSITDSGKAVLVELDQRLGRN